MNTEQYQQKLLLASQEDSQTGKNGANLDISGGMKDQRALRKDKQQHIMALNKKLIKPLTGSKSSSG